MITHRYSIKRLLESLIGYRGIPYLGVALRDRQANKSGYIAEEPTLDVVASPRQEFVKGTRLYKQDALGRWYFMPITLRHKSLSGESHTLELPNAMMSISGSKVIEKTVLPGRNGSVKELICLDDYTIEIAAFIYTNQYPTDEIERMRELYQINESVELISVLSDLVIGTAPQVVITDIQWPPTQGVETGQAVTIKCLTDTNLDLIIP